MSANTLASIALGLCSNLLTCVARAWHYDLDPPPVKSNQEIADKKNAVATSCDGAWASRPVVAAPAMNTYMWHQRITQTHIHALRSRGVVIVEPVAKKLACGDYGMGALASVEDIVKETLNALSN